MTGLWIEGKLIGNAVVTIILFAVGPLALARWNRVDWSEGFRLRGASVPVFIAAILLGFSLWPFAYELELMAISSDRIEIMKELYTKIKAMLDAIPLPAKILAIAFVPAVCEELFFRGYLLTALRTRMSTPLAIALSGGLFGLFHVIAIDSLFFERFVPTCFMGLILGCVCCRTESVLPGMLMHSIHNGLLLSMSSFTEELAELGVGTEMREHLPTLWLVSAGITVVIATGIMVLGSRKGSASNLSRAVT